MLKKLFGLICILIFTPYAWSANIDHLRGQRYCEIFLGYKIQKTEKEKQHYFEIPMKVFNTIGLNNCPENAWQSLNIKTIKQETGAETVKLNGPRMWVIDGMKNSTLVNSQINSFNGITMRQAGTLDFPLHYVLKKPKPYQRFVVARNTTWIYLSGKPVYELITPEGNTYIMQSYSLRLPQTEKNINILEQRLKIPKGWRFQKRTLEKNYYLTPINKKASVIQDNLLNTYQLEVK